MGRLPKKEKEKKLKKKGGKEEEEKNEERSKIGKTKRNRKSLKSQAKPVRTLSRSAVESSGTFRPLLWNLIFGIKLPCGICCNLPAKINLCLIFVTFLYMTYFLFTEIHASLVVFSLHKTRIQKYFPCI